MLKHDLETRTGGQSTILLKKEYDDEVTLSHIAMVIIRIYFLGKKKKIPEIDLWKRKQSFWKYDVIQVAAFFKNKVNSVNG